MGFFSKLAKSIKKSVKEINHLLTHPSEAMALKEDLVRPSKLSYGGFFKKIDPILDTLDPGHNLVQEALTGQSTTEGQLPYFEKIAPVIVSYFFPVAGSLANGVSGVSEGNKQQAIIGFTSYGIGSYASAASAANANIIAQGGTSSTSIISNLSTAQTIGKVVNLGVGAYNFYDAQDKMVASTARIANMVSDKQQSTPIYSAANAGTAYGMLAGDGISNPTGALAAQVMNAGNEAENNKAFLVLAVLGLYLWSKK